MKLSLTLLASVSLLAACGPPLPSRETVELGTTAAGNVTLYVSNQSFDLDPVDITVRIDGKVAVSEHFEVEDQHNWKAYVFDLSVGSHTVRASSQRGEATVESSLEVAAQKWAVINFWYSPSTRGGAEPTPRQLSFSQSDQPITFR